MAIERDNHQGPTRRQFMRAAGLVGAGAVSWQLGLLKTQAAAARASGPSALEVFDFNPKSVYFHRPAQFPALTYAEWEAEFLPLNGMVIHSSNELTPLSPQLGEFGRTFKAAHPEKLVLAQYDGFLRDPADATGYFAGHWLYREGTTITQIAIGADTVLHVADTSVFSLAVGRFGDQGDDIGITLPPGADGKLAWRRAEQVKLLDIDPINSTITVERGRYGTAPLGWDVGAYIAPHIVGGPVGQQAAHHNLCWHYNLATTCPLDPSGRNCADALVDDLVQDFASGGDLEGLDGLEFDVGWFTLERSDQVGVDADADGVADMGMVDGLNVYGIGTLEFTTKLRAALPGKLIMADGQLIREVLGPTNIVENWRSFASLNGIETEGFVTPNDTTLSRWSEGINILDYWHTHAMTPFLRYINFKYADWNQNAPDYARFRLVLAAAVMTGTVFAMFNSPPPGTRRVGIFDELWKGAAQTPNWLGANVGPRVRLAQQTASDIFLSQGITWPQAFVDQFEGTNVAFTRQTVGTTTSLLINSTTPAGPPGLGEEMTFTLPDVSVTGPDLTVTLVLAMDPVDGYDSSIARYIKATVNGVTQAGWADQDGVNLLFYFRDIGPGTHDLTFSVEGRQSLTFTKMRAHLAPDAMYQEFENGLVLANPSNDDYTFDLASLVPGGVFRRLQATSGQDTITNDGSLVGSTVTLGARDGLFLLRES